jgi:hypothetical protein
MLVLRKRGCVKYGERSAPNTSTLDRGTVSKLQPDSTDRFSPQIVSLLAVGMDTISLAVEAGIVLPAHLTAYFSALLVLHCMTRRSLLQAVIPGLIVPYSVHFVRCQRVCPLISRSRAVDSCCLMLAR